MQLRDRVATLALFLRTTWKTSVSILLLIASVKIVQESNNSAEVHEAHRVAK